MVNDSSIVRSTVPDELDRFAALAGSPESAARFAGWVRDRWEEGESRAEWCFVIESDGVPSGRVLYWSFPSSAEELVLAGLHLDWEGEWREAGAELLGRSISRMRAAGGTSLSASVIADPATFPERRKDLYRSLGLPIRQQKLKFHTKSQRESDTGASPLTFRTVEDGSGKEFLDMIERVTEGTLDRSDSNDRLRYGAAEAARRYVELLMEVDPDTRLWQLAFDSDGERIGLVVPQRLDAKRGTINYVGVLPEARGNGYIDALLRRGVDLLHRENLEDLVVDVDVLNAPVIAALKRTGWTSTGGSWLFDLVEPTP